MGYKVWCDLEQLKGGEDFWKEIEKTIRKDAIKFLFVISKASIVKNGTLKELAVADKIRDRGDFIIPLRFEVVSYSVLPAEIIRLNAVDFSSNWASGLNQLLEKLEKDGTPKSNTIPSDQILDSWRLALSIRENVLLNRSERYFSNWFDYTLPNFIYFYRLSGLKGFDVKRLPYPSLVENDYVLTFACPDCVGILANGVSVTAEEKIIVEQFIKDQNFTLPGLKIVITDTHRKVVQLLNQSFSLFCLSKGLLSYSLSSDEVYYFPSPASGMPTKVSLEKYGRRTIQLVGYTDEFNWHYAIRGDASLYPSRFFSISYHVIFSESNGQPIDVKRQHSKRRSIGKHWYNKKWRDLLLGAMLKMSSQPSDNTIAIPVCCKQVVTLNNSPVSFISPLGYEEPK